VYVRDPSLELGLRLSSHHRSPYPPALFMKRLIDVVGSAAAAALSAPLLALIAFRIACESSGRVFFCQTRIGVRDRPFRMFKFRTMMVDAESRLDEVRHLNIHASFGDTRLYKGVEDPRVTPFGARLRRFSLDELPQLFNVLRGDMSLVGPRPLTPDEDCHIIGEARTRLSMRPGITGLWQVSGRNALSFDEMIRLDLEYVSRWRLRDDLRILLKTLPAMLERQEAS
jgi:lipopolysaccharide/colanic/teichoic acid biosynthesis glycosyltransferase